MEREYPVTVDRVVDGDTIDVTIDLGFKIYTKERVRLDGINCPETRTKDPEEKEAGLAAKQFVIDVLGKAEAVYLYSKKFETGKYGRVVGDIWYDTGEELESLCDQLVKNGHAKEVTY